MLAAVGCGGAGGDDDKTFEGRGYSFTYAGAWEERDAEALTGSADVVIAPRPGRDAISLSVFEVQEPITEANIDKLQPEIRNAARQYLMRAGRSELTAEPVRTTIAGLPGVRFEGSTRRGGGVHTRATWLFGGRTVYALTCQSTSAGTDEVGPVCDQVLGSFALE